MRSPGNHRARVLVLAGLLAGCLPTCLPAKPKKGAPTDDLGTLKLPPARPPRIALTPEEAALVYPPIDKVDRDPFLTAAEEDLYDGRPAAPAPVVAVAARTVRGKPHVDKIIASLHQQVKGIIVGPRNTFLFDGKFYEEGDMLPGDNWKVIGITENGIHLKTVSGSQTDFLRFNIDAAPSFHLHSKH